MRNRIEIVNSPKSFNRTDHLANERTFLAWVRTSLGIMAFGFVVEKFAFFVNKLTAFLEKPGDKEHFLPHSNIFGYSSIFGIFLVAFGALLSVLAYLHFKSVEKQINEDSYRPSRMLDLILTLFVVLVAVFLIIYLIGSIRSS